MTKRFEVLFFCWFAVALPPTIVQASASLQSFTVTASTPSSDVFASVGGQSVPDAGHTTWPVTINLALLSALPSSVIVNFPDRAAATLTRMSSELRGPGAFLWTGRGGGCSAMFSAAPINFRGVISCSNAPYGIEATSSGLQLIRSNPPSGAPSSAWEPRPASGPGSFAPLSPPALTPCKTPPQTTDTAIEILVLYNDTVRQAIDGPGVGTALTVKFMHDAVDTTQTALNQSTSGYPIQPPIARVAFVGAQEVTRGEDGDIDADLQYITTDVEPANFRTFYGADLVMYVTESGGGTYLGASNVPYYNASFPVPGPFFAPYSASVVQRNRAINDTSGVPFSSQEPYVFPHEFAHQLGANHDNSAVDNFNTTPLTNYAFGKWAAHIDGGERTIMSYRVSPQCTAPCTRVLYYSNPNVQVIDDWFVTGSSTANNALVIQTYANDTAQYCVSLGRIFASAFEDRFHNP